MIYPSSDFGYPLWKLITAPLLAIVLAYAVTPSVKRLAEKLDAMDVPRDGRRIHDHPIPRMGGLAIYIAFVLSVILLVEPNRQVMGLVLGATIIVAMGVLDDVVCLGPWVKLAGQFLAAYTVIRCGVVFDMLSLYVDGIRTSVDIGFLSVPLTFLWIVMCTNAVNLIDGLDGLAAGISTISSLSLLMVSLLLPMSYSAAGVPLILACLSGSCIGFIPYNLNPAKIFMGDTGSQFLGFVLAVVSTMGLFKYHAIISMLSLALPLFDTAFAFLRRILHGQSPFHPDRGHIHHRLLAMGMSQKQVVAFLYGISTILGLFAILIAATGRLRIICLVAAVVLFFIMLWIFGRSAKKHAEAVAAAETIGAYSTEEAPAVTVAPEETPTENSSIPQ